MPKSLKIRQKKVEGAKARAENTSSEINKAAQSIEVTKKRIEEDARRISELKEKTKLIDLLGVSVAYWCLVYSLYWWGKLSDLLWVSVAYWCLVYSFFKKEWSALSIAPIGITLIYIYCVQIWWGKLSDLLLVSVAYWCLVYSFFKKEWSALSIALFVIGIFLAQSVLLESLHDTPITFNAVNPELHAQDSYKIQTCAYISQITCEPPYNSAFIENRASECTIDITRPTNNENCSIGTPHCKGVIGRYVVSNLNFTITTQEGYCDILPAINNYGKHPVLMRLGPAGYKYFEFQLACYDEDIEKDLRNCSTANRIGANIVGSSIYVRSTSEVDNIRTGGRYQFIIALFALFGIFPAVFYLRGLWVG